jgi:uncharacterized UBP type Zn finger protein
MEFGFSKIIAEKALFMTGCKGVEKALDWINAHSEDADFNEELFIVGQEEQAAKPKSNLTKEEAAQKARELQAKIRAKRQAEEEKNAIESEAMRKKMDKEITEAKKINEEREYENAMNMKMMEKKK